MAKVGSRLQGPKGRMYQGEDGKPRPSVTNVLGVWPAPWLVDWKVKNIARKVMAGDKSLTRAMKTLKKLDKNLVGTAVASGALEQTLLDMSEDTTKADRGTRIHEGVERLILGEKKKAVKGDMVPEEFVQVEKIMGELMRLKINITHTEATILGDLPGPYGGTLDLLGDIKMTISSKTRISRCVVDLKTGKMSRTMSAQLYAYGTASRIVTNIKGETQRVEDMPKIHRGLIIQTADTKVKTWEADWEDGRRVWNQCYEMYVLENKTPKKLELM